jgi:hypothetical protein
MANKPIKFKLDVTKIDKTHLYKGAKGTYLDCVVWPNKNGADKFGFTHYVVQEISREAREAGGKGAIIGNLALPEQVDYARQKMHGSEMPPALKQAQQDGPLDGSFEDDSIPF